MYAVCHWKKKKILNDNNKKRKKVFLKMRNSHLSINH